jgi:hypothetical protein
MCILRVSSGLTARAASRYAARMKSRGVAVMLVLCAGLFPCLLFAAEERPAAAVISAEDYGLYDQVIERTFLTSHTMLVLIERMTVARLSPDQTGPMTLGFFHDRNYFLGRLPQDLVRDFVGANREAGRLESRFQFGVRYRFVTGPSIEEPEVAAAVPVQDGRSKPAQALPVLERLAFSRVGRTFRNDQALLYVEQIRPDETGAGFLVWFHRKGREWTIFDTEVVWTIRAEEGPGESP